MEHRTASAPLPFVRALFRALPGGLILLALSVFFFSCAGVEEPPAVMPEPVREPAPARNPVTVDWAGTTWILPDPPDAEPRRHPDYRGFHLGRDGRLLLVNLDSATGNTWSAEGGRLRLDLMEGVPEIPVEGVFLAYAVEEEDAANPGAPAAAGNDAASADHGIPGRIRLVPEALPDSEGLILERAEVNKDLVFNHWVPMTMRDGGTVPWPAGREIHLMLLSDGKGGLGVLGYGGENRFHGSVVVGDEDFIVGAIAMTKRFGPASAFEKLYVGHVDAADRYVQVRDDLYLYDDTRFLVSFKAKIFD